MTSHKGRQSSSNKKNNRGSTAFERTVKRTGRWRGKPVDKYIKYKKKK